jgi:hypothetical protein
MTGRNGRSSWKQKGIVAICTWQCNRIEYVHTYLFQDTGEGKNALAAVRKVLHCGENVASLS